MKASPLLVAQGLSRALASKVAAAPNFLQNESMEYTASQQQ